MIIIRIITSILISLFLVIGCPTSSYANIYINVMGMIPGMLPQTSVTGGNNNSTQNVPGNAVPPVVNPGTVQPQNSTQTSKNLPNALNFILQGNNGTDVNTSGLIDSIDDSFSAGLSNILSILYKIGVLVALCTFTYMGVQILITSPQQKAQVKESMKPYFIGLLLFIAGVPIAIFIINIFLQVL